MFNIGNVVSNKLNTLRNLGNESITRLSNNVTSELNSSIRVIQDQVQGVAGDVQGAISQVQSGLDNLGDNIPDFFGQGITSLANSALSFASPFVSAVRSATNLVQFLDFGGAIAEALTGGQNPGVGAGPNVRIKNPLEQYASYNAIFTIGALSDTQVASPSQYRSNGAAVSVLKSSGGGFDNRIRNFYEYATNRRVEYFIDDVEIQSIITPSVRTGVGTSHKIEFTVIEPYSIGQWLLAMQGAATSQNYRNYTDANYLLTVEFVGFDENNNQPEMIPDTTRYIPFRLINVEFNVDQGGTIYKVEAIPINDHALSDEIQRVPTESNFTGPTVAAALATSEDSLMEAINQRQTDIENSTNIDRADLYLITFPETRDNPVDQPANTVGGSATVDVSGDRGIQSGQELFAGALENVFTDWFSGITQQDIGYGIGQIDPRLAQAAGITESSTRTQAEQLFDQLNIQSIGQMNAIGRSAIIQDYNASGDNPFAHAGFTYDEANGIYRRNNIELTISDTDRQFKFPQNMTIQEIIEEMVLISDYGRNAMNLIDADGMIPWFRLETEVYPINAPAAEAILGRKPRIFVYKVVPYRVSADRFSTPDQPTPNTRNLARQAVKEYDYVYTGLNRDILSLDLEFKAAFYDMINTTLGNANRGTNTGGPDNTTAITETPATLANPTGSATDGVKAYFGPGPVTGAGGTYDSNVAEQIARQFHASILNGVDMLQADMEIWGDPYYIPDSGMGNYTAAPTASTNVTQDGTIDYQYSQAQVLLRIRTPIDYDESTGLMIFQDDILEDLANLGGLYQVLEIISKFKNGKFTQDLKMMRIRNQGTEGTANEPLVTNNNPNPNTATGRINGGVAGIVGANGGAAANGAGAASAGPDDGFRGNSGANGSGPSSAQQLSSGPGVAPPTPSAPSNGQEGPTQVLRTPGGRSFTVAQLYAQNFQGLVDELEGDLGYEIRSIGGLSDRNIAGTGTLSWHSMGLAIDINPSQNPHNKPGPLVTDMPANGTGSLMDALANKYGLGWGGSWRSSKDAMHFSAGRNEGGTYQGARDGRVPPGRQG